MALLNLQSLEEVRINENWEKAISFPPEAVVDVRLGKRSEPETERAIKEQLCQLDRVALSRAKLDDSDYRLHFDPIES